MLTNGQVQVLARAYALLVREGLMSWAAVEKDMMRPQSVHMFWRYANSAYRRLAIYFADQFLQVGSLSVNTCNPT